MECIEQLKPKLRSAQEVAASVRSGDRVDYGFALAQPDLFVDGMVDLGEAGKVSGRRKQSQPGKIVSTFAVGSRRSYEFLDGNEQCLSLPVDLTNLSHRVAENRNVVSINNCMQIDLSGQIASESAGQRHVSGTGGQLQFVRGVFMSEGGKSFMCLSSRHRDKQGRFASRIVPGLSSGTVVTTPRTDAMHVVTEHGIANLKGLSVSERTRALIGLAHPDDRDALYEAAGHQGMLGRRFYRIYDLATGEENDGFQTEFTKSPNSCGHAVPGMRRGGAARWQ